MTTAIIQSIIYNKSPIKFALLIIVGSFCTFINFSLLVQNQLYNNTWSNRIPADSYSYYTFNLSENVTSKEVAQFIQRLPVELDIDCDYFIDLDQSRWTYKEWLFNNKKQTRQEIFKYDDCSYLKSQGFLLPASQEEMDYPIAYSIVVYRDLHQFTRLLRSIYRQHNVYCIHVDLKSSQGLYSSIFNMASCLDNVYIPEVRIDVKWGSFSVLEADLICMRSLWKHRVKWTTFINLTGQDFPLRTSKQLVRILRDTMNGSNQVEVDSCNKNIFRTYAWNSSYCKRLTKSGWSERWSSKSNPAPHGFQPVKGSVHVVLSRDFVNFLLHNQTSLDFLEWISNSTFIPDELYFSTMNNQENIKAPGSNADPRVYRPSYARLKVWSHDTNGTSCTKVTRGVCIMSLKNLKEMTSSDKLFVNKFFQDYSPLGYSCLERWHFLKVWVELAATEIKLKLT